MRFVYSKEHLAYLKSGFKAHKIPALCIEFNKKFDLQMTPEQIKTVLKNYRFRCGRKPGATKGEFIKFTQEQYKFICRQYPKLSRKDLTSAFNEKFNCAKTVAQIITFVSKQKIQSGRSGHFAADREVWNTGTKGAMKANSGSFKPGHKKSKVCAIGTERPTVEGYIEIKIAAPNVWQIKSRYVWEQQHGPIAPGHKVRFLDGDRNNCALLNLFLVDDRESVVLTRALKFKDCPIEARPVLVSLARLSVKTDRLSESL